jgi:hypothetical protein
MSCGQHTLNQHRAFITTAQTAVTRTDHILYVTRITNPTFVVIDYRRPQTIHANTPETTRHRSYNARLVARTLPRMT